MACWSIKIYRALALAIFSLLLQGCKSKPIEIVDVNSFYNDAVALLEKNSLKESIDYFDAIETEYPESEYAKNASMLRAYATYLKGDYFETSLITEDFIKKYPADQNLDYVCYLRAMSKYSEIADLARDQKITTDALNAFEDLIKRFPNSKYADDVAQKKLYAYNSIVGHDIAIARFYSKTGKFIPALKRYEMVVRNYSQSMFIEEALYRMTETYLKIGSYDDAIIYAAVLGFNYPSSPWYHRSYNLMKKHGYVE